MSQSYYSYRFRADHANLYLIWYTEESSQDDSDGVVLDEGGRVAVFHTLDDLVAFARDNALSPLSNETTDLCRIDVIQKWLKRKRNRTAPIDCAAFLDIWNLFADVSRSLGGDFDADLQWTQTIYQKLFFGNDNLSRLLTGKCCFRPIWSSKEQRIIRGVMVRGLTLFCRRTLHGDTVHHL